MPLSRSKKILFGILLGAALCVGGGWLFLQMHPILVSVRAASRMIERHDAELSAVLSLFEAHANLESLDAQTQVYWWKSPDQAGWEAHTFTDWPCEFGPSLEDLMRPLREVGLARARRNMVPKLGEHIAFVFDAHGFSDTGILAAHIPNGMEHSNNCQEMKSLRSLRWIKLTSVQTYWCRVKDNWYIVVVNRV